MTILALDQSSRTTGYAIFKDNKLDIYGKFSFDDKDVGVRLSKIRYEIFTLIQINKPDYVVFEDIQLQNNVGNNVQTFKALAEVYGIISELLTSLEIPHSSVMSTSWKSTLHISGRTRPEQKKSAQEYVIKKYGVKPTQDECDAICIGEHYINSCMGAWSD